MVELSPVFETLLKDLWKKFDKGGDEKVSGKEFTDGIKDLLPNPSIEKIEKVVK